MTTLANSLSVNEQLHIAVSAIASVCDGAHTRDNMGFSGPDVKFGHRAASIPASEWTNDMAYDVYHMLRIYRGQLMGYGINYDELPNPGGEATGIGRRDAYAIEYQRSHAPYITISDTRIDVYNSFPVKDALKAVGFRFDRDIKSWFAEISPKVAATILGVVEILITDEHREYLSKVADQFSPEQEAEEKAASGIVNIYVSSEFSGMLWLKTEWGQVPLPVIRGIPGRKWKPDYKANLVSPHIGLIELAKEFGLTISPEAMVMIESHREAQEQEAAIKKAAIAASIATETTYEIPDGLKGHLYNFQQAGVAYAMDHFGATIIADEPGLGKTRQALITAELGNAFPLLVVCPASVKFVWLNEIKKILPHRTAEVYTGRLRKDELFDIPEDIIILGYPSIQSYIQTLPTELGGMVCDEAHFIKNEKAARTKAILQIMGKAHDEQGHPIPGLMRKVSPMRMFLTGTPVLNRPSELVSPLLALGILTTIRGQINSVGAFLYKYCNPEGTKGRMTFKGLTPGMGEELNRWLRIECMVRRTKKQVLTDLPSKTIAPLFIQLSDSARAMYARMEELAAEKAAASKASALVELNALRTAIGDVKIEQAVAWINEFLELSDKSLIVFANHKPVQAEIIRAMREHDENCPKDEKYNVTYILGAQKGEVTEEMKAKFQAKESRVIVLSFDAAGIGHTLTAASDVLFTELGWNPGTHRQAEDRAHRIGQTEPVTCYYLIALDTIDEWLHELIEAKKVIVDSVTDGVMMEEENSSIFKEVVERLARKHGNSVAW